MKRVLNVGGCTKEIELPAHYKDYEHVLLDIDPSCKPDLLWDARKLTELDPEQFDAVYCSHNLEHFYRHEVRQVLSGMMHVLKPGGVVEIIVPDLLELMKLVVNEQRDIDDVLFTAPIGPIMAVDVIYGYSRQLELSGTEWWAHKTGFSEKSLLTALYRAGFRQFYTRFEDLQIIVYAFVSPPDEATKAHFRLSGGA